MSGIPPAVALAHLGLLDELTPEELYWLYHDRQFWAREDQYPPPGKWRYWTLLCGRGWGKGWTLASWINEQVDSGQVRSICLLAQGETQIRQNQAEPLVAASPPWNRAVLSGDKVTWANGAEAVIRSPYEPDGIRSGNYDLSWCSEIRFWPGATRKDAWETVTSATRVGDARVVIDTTSKGKNEILKELLELHEKDPKLFPLTRGTTFDNLAYSKIFLQTEWNKYKGKRREEELSGAVYEESDGSAYEQLWIDNSRRGVAPPNLEIRIVAMDPAIQNNEDSDATGIIVAGRAPDGDIYILKDRSGKYDPEQWAAIAVEENVKYGAAGVVMEMNRGQKLLTANLRAVASLKGIDVRTLRKEQRFPKYTPGVLYVREVNVTGDKLSRAHGPAALMAGDDNGKDGRVHIVGEMGDLEYELTTYNGEGQSPNRFDAMQTAVHELASLEGGQAPAPKPVTPDQAPAYLKQQAEVRAQLAAATQRGRDRDVF